jgi:hypothetical protein
MANLCKVYGSSVQDFDKFVLNKFFIACLTSTIQVQFNVNTKFKDNKWRASSQ